MRNRITYLVYWPQGKDDLVPLFGTLTNIEKEVFRESEKSLYAGVQI
jgi:hypothetical protein